MGGIECGKWGWVGQGRVMGEDGDNCNGTTIQKFKNEGCVHVPIIASIGM